MSIETRDFDTMVDSVCQKVVDANVGITDVGIGSIMRTLVESIISEVDIQNADITDVYNALDIDDATDEDLDKLVSIFGVTRKPAGSFVGKMCQQFSCSNPVISDIPIPAGTIVSTLPDTNGNIIEIATTADVILTIGNVSVVADVQAVNAGLISVSQGQVRIMTNPIIGIENTTNIINYDGGSDIETDDELRERAKNALQAIGNATNAALKGAIEDIDGVKIATVKDMNRGIATSDVVIITNIIPAPDDIKELILTTIADNKASGIDVQPVYPTTTPIDITLTSTNSDSVTINNSIMAYFSTLNVGDAFIVDRMKNTIIIAFSDPTMVIPITAPTADIAGIDNTLFIPGVITINGVVCNG